MEKLWAPWRKRYVIKTKTKKCFLCDKLKRRKNKSSYVVELGALSFSILNLYPYNAGHVLVAPRRHIASLDKLTSKELTDMFDLARRTVGLLERTLRPEGFNVGLNLGRVSGAGLSCHLHVHVVPRWRGDTNFMPVIGDTKVVSESLNSLMRTLKNAL